MPTAEATTTEDDLLAGITAKTTKPELIDRLEKAQERLRKHERVTTDRLKEIEERVRAKDRPGSRAEVLSVMVTATSHEFEEATNFMDEFEELLPIALLRLQLGMRAIKEGKAT